MSPNLERLAQSGELKTERLSRLEFESMLRTAGALLADASQPGLSLQSRFGLAYAASYTLANAALRIHGYRARHRYLAFQCLEHTAGLTRAECRFFTLCHDRRNKAEYEGVFNSDETLVEDLIRAAESLRGRVSSMGPL